MHAPTFGLRACFNFFGQGSSSRLQGVLWLIHLPVDPQRQNVGLGSSVHFRFESSGSFVFNDAQAQRDEGLRALLLVIVDAVRPN